MSTPRRRMSAMPAQNTPTMPATRRMSTNSVARGAARPRAMSVTALSAAPRLRSFKEKQRIHAMQMEFFGFAGWLASTGLYVLFLVWAYLPDATLEAYGFTFLPPKHWALAMPSMLVMTYMFSIVLYKAISLLGTPALDSYATVLDVHSTFKRDDRHANNEEDDSAHRCQQADADAATPPIYDVSIFDVNTHMLGY